MNSPAAPDWTAPSSVDGGRSACDSLGLPRDDRVESSRELIVSRVWDSIVIGAGPAGAVCGYLLARSGRRVLLLDRARWPRGKVCGGCLSASSIACLRKIGLMSVVHDATPIRSSHLHAGRSVAAIPITDSVAIDREVFDARLVEQFIRAGGTFVDRASATLIATKHAAAERVVRLQLDGDTIAARTRSVLAADGLAGSSLSAEPWAAWTIARGARIGVSTSIDDLDIAPGEIHMHVGTDGYVGAVRYERGAVHLAAALDPKACRQAGGPGALMEAVLRSCGRDASLCDARLHGAPTLTRHRTQLGGHRVLALGDACGYIEPFTGEGIAWALRTAIDAAALLPDDWTREFPEEWRNVRRAAIGRKQTFCRFVKFAAHHPLLARSVVGMLKIAPSLAAVVTRASTIARAPTNIPTIGRAL